MRFKGVDSVQSEFLMKCGENEIIETESEIIGQVLLYAYFVIDIHFRTLLYLVHINLKYKL